MSDSLLVRYSPTQPALNTLVVSQFADKLVKVKLLPKKDQPHVEATFVPSGNVLRGDIVIARYIARATPQLELYGTDPLTQTQVDQWIDVSKALKTDFDASAKQIQTHLSSRKFLVNDKLTLADIAIWAEISLLNKSQDLPEALQKWIKSIEELPEVKANLKNVPKSTTDKAAEAPKKAKVSMELNLQNVEKGKVVTRFPPEPSGYLHVGHMKAALLNNYYARANEGKLILRFDDTNPAKEKEEYVENLIADLKRIEIQPDIISHTSDHFDLLLQYAERLIKEGKGYMDATPKEKLRAERMDGIESVYRSNTIEENLKMWEEFKKATDLGKTYVLRGKIDMQSKNKALRDPIFYRVNETPHHRTGTKYKVYPIYDFACPIVDSIEGVTHALRSIEYHDRQPLYYWVIDAFNLRRVQVEDFSRLSFKYTVLSKRYLQAFINKGLVSGWDDPAFPTIQGLLRRGLTVEGARQYILSQGASKNTVNIQIESMWAINKQVIDPIVPRYTAFPSNQRTKFVLSNGPAKPEQRSVARHKKNPSLGEKVLTYTNDIYLELEDAKGLVPDEEVTLMDWGNAIIRQVIKNDAGEVSELRGELHLEGDFKTTKKKLTWLPAIEDLVEATLVEYGNLITTEKLEKDEPIENYINPKLKTETIAIGDPNLRLLPKGQRIQLERRGYFIVDQPYLPPSSKLVLILIPDGRMVDVYKRG